jgi:hypothetical protein
MDIWPRFGLGTLNNPDDYVTFNNCSLTSEYDENINGSPAVPGNIRFARFTGSTKIVHTAGPGYNPYYSIIQATTINGSKSFFPMNAFVFADHYHYWCGAPYPQEAAVASSYPFIFGETPCEYLNVFIGDGAPDAKSDFSNFLRPLYIGEGTTLTVRSGSALVLSGDIYLAGKIVVESGAYLWFGNNPTIHYLGSTTFASHLNLQSGSITSISPPFVYSFSSTSTYILDPVNLRSELMAPNEYLRTEVANYRSNYDNLSIKCPQCVLDIPTQQYNCTPIDSTKYHPFKGVANIGFDFNDNINIYPNPTNDKIYISNSNTDQPSDIQLLDINGRQLYKTSSKDAETEISLSKYPQGTYLIRISNATNSVVKKVVKTN